MNTQIGQNFLVNRNVAEKIVNRFLPVEGNILEIGPGKGVLTGILIERREDNPVTAVELDPSLYRLLKDKYTENFKILNRDILQIDLTLLFPGETETVNIIGNVPYYISKELIDWALAHYRKIKKGVFMMQKEFVNKLASTPGTGAYNAQAVIFNGLFRLEKLFDVQPGSFSPPPKVKSTVFLFEPALEKRIEKINPHEFYRFLNRCFSSRRKTVMNNLSYFKEERLHAFLEAQSINPKTRAEQLTLDEFIKIYTHLFPII